jgi:beta-lactamase superfamily II metal-dependent hydrolase
MNNDQMHLKTIPYCHQGQQWHYPELDIEILWPKKDGFCCF